MHRSALKADQRSRVLLVDDDVHLTRAVAAGLESKGFRVTTAGTAKEALQAVADCPVPIDVIVMDIMLPDSWGSQVAMEQRLFLPEARVIFISGYAAGDTILDASSLSGDTPFLSKPFTIEKLAGLIHRVLEVEPGDEVER